MGPEQVAMIVELALRRVADRMMYAHQFENAPLALDTHKALKDVADELAKELATFHQLRVKQQ